MRKFTLAAHIGLSVGWIGALAAYIALDVAAAIAVDVALLRGAYLAMDLIVQYVIVPLAVAALLTGVVVSAWTRWGLLHHWWVVISLLLTVFATVVLLIETRTTSHLAAAAADPATSRDALRAMGNTLVHSVGGMVVLIVILVLNVYKPAGLTPYGWRKQRERRTSSPL